MVFRYYERSQDTEVVTSFGESMTGGIDLPRDRRIAELVLDVQARIANASTTATMTKRQLYSIFDNITLKVNGAVGNINVEGARYYDFVKYLTGKEPVVIVNEVPIAEGETISCTGSGNTDVRFQVPFYFRKDVRNPYDVSALLDAFAMSSLRVEFSTRSGWLPANTNLTITEANSNVRAWVKEVVIDNDTLKKVNAMNGNSEFYNVFYTQQQDKVLTTSTGLANSVDLMTSYIHQDIMFHTYDASAGDWVNDIIDKIRVKAITSQGDVEFMEQNWEDSQFEDMNDMGVHVLSKGATMWNCESKMGGLDTRALKTGDLKIHYTTGGTLSSGNDLLDVMYKSLLPASI